MIRRLIKIAVIMGALLLGGNVIAGEDLSNGEAKYNEVCATCHGNYGEISDDVIPNILGQ